MSHVLGLDVSTTATKAVLLDTAGGVQAAACPEYTFETPHPLWSEQDPERWWDGTVAGGPGRARGLGRPRRRTSRRSDSAVRCTGWSRWIGHDEVLRPAILWNDQRTEAECDADPGDDRQGATDRDHRQRRAPGLHRAEAPVGPAPRARRVVADRPRPAAEGLRPAASDGGPRRRPGRRRRHPAVRPRGARLVRRGRGRARASIRRGCPPTYEGPDVTGSISPEPRRRPGCGRARRWWRAAAIRRRPRWAWVPSSPAWSRSRSARRGSCSPRPTDR